VHQIPMENVVKAIYDYNRVWIRTMTTGNLNGVRAATHIYNMPDEVDRLLDAVTHVAKNQSRYMTTTTAGTRGQGPGN
jgi:selenocysteine lyase/cysteine desulfurase